MHGSSFWHLQLGEYPGNRLFKADKNAHLEVHDPAIPSTPTRLEHTEDVESTNVSASKEIAKLRIQDDSTESQDARQTIKAVCLVILTLVLVFVQSTSLPVAHRYACAHTNIHVYI